MMLVVVPRVRKWANHGEGLGRKRDDDKRTTLCNIIYYY